MSAGFSYCMPMRLHTTSTLPFPFSLTLKGNDSSRPVVGSWKVRKAWLGRFPDLFSVVVRTILRVSDAPNEMSLERRLPGESLGDVYQRVAELP